MSDGGKGSSRRPTLVDQKTFDMNWELIFGRDSSVEEPVEDDYVQLDDEGNPIYGMGV